jgi:hypothetical protein
LAGLEGVPPLRGIGKMLCFEGVAGIQCRQIRHSKRVIAKFFYLMGLAPFDRILLRISYRVVIPLPTSIVKSLARDYATRIAASGAGFRGLGG